MNKVLTSIVKNEMKINIVKEKRDSLRYVELISTNPSIVTRPNVTYCVSNDEKLNER